MKLFVQRHNGLVVFRARATDDRGSVGDLIIDLHPGQSAFGLNYEQWLAWTTGSVVLAPDGKVLNPQPPAAP